MKKFLGILAVLAGGLFVFGIVSTDDRSEQERSSAKTGRTTSETAKADQPRHITRSVAAACDRQRRRFLGQTRRDRRTEDGAHARPATVGGVPVWEGEAIVHLKPDGELSTIDRRPERRTCGRHQTPNLTEQDAVDLA